VCCGHTEKEPLRKKSRETLFYLWGFPGGSQGKKRVFPGEGTSLKEKVFTKKEPRRLHILVKE